MHGAGSDETAPGPELTAFRDSMVSTRERYREDTQRTTDRIAMLEECFKRASPGGSAVSTPRVGNNSGRALSEPQTQPEASPLVSPVPAVHTPPSPAPASPGRFSSRRTPPLRRPPPPPHCSSLERFLQDTGLPDERLVRLTLRELHHALEDHRVPAPDRATIERHWKREQGRPPSKDEVRARSRSPSGPTLRLATHTSGFTLSTVDQYARLSARRPLSPRPLGRCDPNRVADHHTPQPQRPPSRTPERRSNPNSAVALQRHPPPAGKALVQPSRPAASDLGSGLPEELHTRGRRVFAKARSRGPL